MKILSIPAVEDFPYESLQQEKYDLLEFRLDYTENPSQLPARIISLLSCGKEIIFTIRDISEGGVREYPFDKKISLYRKLISSYDCLIDCELNLFIDKKPDLPEQNLILSLHVSPETANREDLIKHSIQKANQYSPRFLKITTPVESFSEMDNFFIWSKMSRNPLLLSGSGTLGKLSRILWKYLGSIGSYTAVEGFLTAAEQLTSDEYELFGCRHLAEDMLIGGLIGGRQVYNSLGLSFYNRKLKALNNRVVYLPFAVNDLSDFLSWLQKTNKKTFFYGFSVTMPHKNKLPSFFSVPERPVNLISVSTDSERQLPFNKPNLFINTDLHAFTLALKKLKTEKRADTLVYGTGATAESFISNFSGFLNLVISGRNDTAVRELADKYGIGYLKSLNVKDKVFDLIVNCTPIGMLNEDLFEETNCSIPKALIDLPYRKEKTKAVSSCLEKGVPVIDGHTFWLFQAKKQEETFIDNILRLSEK